MLQWRDLDLTRFSSMCKIHTARLQVILSKNEFFCREIDSIFEAIRNFDARNKNYVPLEERVGQYKAYQNESERMLKLAIEQVLNPLYNSALPLRNSTPFTHKRFSKK